MRLPRCAAALLLLAASPAIAANGRWQNVYGSFRSWTPGIPVVYATDPGPLSPNVSHATADALVATVASIWSSVPTSSLTIAQSGTLAEDVDGSNVYLTDSGVVMPADVTAGGPGPALAVIYDYDGAVTDTLLGVGASDPSSCNQHAVTESVDAFAYATLITHAILILNGRCVPDGTSDELLQMQYQLLRTFGRVLGVGWSQLNDNVFTGDPQPTYEQQQDWPLMHPLDIVCGRFTYLCLVSPFTLRMDDISSLSTLYPVASDASLPGKRPTRFDSLMLGGTVTFPDGRGMQGVNVEAHLIYAGTGIVDTAAIVSGVSGRYFIGDAPTPVTGSTNADGQQLTLYGVTDPADEGAYLINEIDLLPGIGWLNVQLVPVPINPLYTGDYAVGPYTISQVAPSGTLAPVIAYCAGIGAATLGNLPIADAASPGAQLDGTQSDPMPVPASGWWSSSLSAYGHIAWYSLNAQPGSTFAVEVTALDADGYATTTKMLPVLGAWNLADPPGTAPFAATAQAFNSVSLGVSTLAVTAPGPVTLAIADQRGDGRPDFAFTARVLAATAIAPAALPATGGNVTLTGLGFRPSIHVTIGGVAAKIVSVTANQIVAVAPASSNTGVALDVTVTDLTTRSTTLPAAFTYAPPLPPVTPPLLILSGDAQSLPASDSTSTFAPVVLEATDGAGHPVSGIAVSIDQTVTAWAPPCPPTGRCPQPAVFGSSSATLTTDASGRVSVTPLEVAGSEFTHLLATTSAGGYIQSTLQKN